MPRRPLPNGLRVAAFVLALAGVASFAGSTRAAAAPSVPLPTYTVSVAPYTTERQDPSSCYQFDWLKFRSPTVAGPADRMLHVAGSGPDVHDEWWIALEEKIGSGWDAHGAGGYYLNFHNVAGDVGNTGAGGIGWGFGSGVSPVALAYGAPTPLVPSRNRLHLEYAGIPGAEIALPDPDPNTWFSIVLHVVFGRTDGTTRRPGSVQVWYDGGDRPVVDLQNVNTLQRATNPATGKTYTQEWVDAWQGGPYSQGDPCHRVGPVTRTSETVAARFGTTVAQMVGDTDISLDTARSYGSVHIPGQPDYGDSWAKPSPTQRTTSDFLLPPSLAAAADGSQPPPSEPPPPDGPATGVVTDPYCSVCRVTADGTKLTASIAGGLDKVDTAYLATDLGVGGGRLYLRDEVGLQPGQLLTANLAVLQVHADDGSLLYELYLDRDRALHLWSPAGALRAREINAPTGVVVPNDGSSVRIEVSSLANDSIIVRADGVDRLTVPHLGGGTAGDPRYAWVGIDHYDSGALIEYVTVVHDHVAASRTGWLGAPADDPVEPPAPPTPPSPPSPPSPPAPPSDPAALVPDGGFESDPTGAWYFVGDGGSYGWSAGDAHSGSRSATIVSNVGGMTRWMTRTTAIPVDPGAVYTASAYLKTDGRGAVALVFWDAGGHALGGSESAPVPRGGWSRAVVQSIAPAAAAYVRIELRLHEPGHLAADDVSLTDG